MLGIALSICTPAFAGEVEWTSEFNAGRAAYRAGNYRAATPRYEAALREAESFDANDPRLPTTLNTLAESYRMQGRLAEAEPLFRRSLGIREKALGPDHPSVGLALNNLAALYEAQGRLADAEPLKRHRRVAQPLGEAQREGIHSRRGARGARRNHAGTSR